MRACITQPVDGDVDREELARSDVLQPPDRTGKERPAPRAVPLTAPQFLAQRGRQTQSAPDWVKKKSRPQTKSPDPAGDPHRKADPMPDDHSARWETADAAAARLAAVAVAADHTDPAWTTQEQTQAADILALALRALADQGKADPASVPTWQIHDAVTAADFDRWLDAALAGTARQDWPAYLRRHDPSVTARDAHRHAVTATVAVMMAEVHGLRLLDRVLAPLPGRDVLYPGQIVGVSADGAPSDADDIEFTVQVLMDHHRDDYNLAAAREVLFDIDPAAATGHAQRTHGRSTHGHAVRCAVADLRRAADSLGRGDPEAGLAIPELLRRIPLYTGYEDLHQQLMTIAAALLAATGPPPCRPRWRPVPFPAQIIDRIRRGAQRLRDTSATAGERERQRTYLLDAASKFEAANL
ncbi:hypothetical protein AB0M46_21450 [Dactylosporangium sp. NPDC051485]|uniref:hypothetical protein n=1 Tax=Dactylosporangium sp. NPDC051485 TaxID=3154846 RepID=UPI0034179C48